MPDTVGVLMKRLRVSEKLFRNRDCLLPVPAIRYVSILDLATLNQETGEICCPTCGSWTNVDDLVGDEFGPAKCPLCA